MKSLLLKWNALAAMFLAACVLPALATDAPDEECPSTADAGPTVSSIVRPLRGNLIYHDGIRQWFELELDRPQCGQPSIQLIPEKDGSTDFQVFRGCEVRTVGQIDFSPTGYYSLDMFQTVLEIRPSGTCARQTPFAASSARLPDQSIRRYRVEMDVNYRPGDHPIVFRVMGSGKKLSPWQMYASYWMTGDFVLYGLCPKGFVVRDVFGTKQAHPMHFSDPGSQEDMATFDPEGAKASGTFDLRLGYTCARGGAG